MKAPARGAAFVLACIGMFVAWPDANAQTNDSPPAASRFYPLVGNWTGRGQLEGSGQEPATLSLTLSCVEASSGWAVRCEMIAKNEEMTMTESDLMGVDATTGQGHWYAVTDQGDTHDHLTKWINAKTMNADYAWSQDGKQMHEEITIMLPDDRTMKFRSVVSADGQQVSEFSGDLSR